MPRDSRETALDVKIILERSGAAGSRKGTGALLLASYYVGDAPWSSFSDREKRTIRKAARAFQCALCIVDFVRPCDRPVRSCGRGKG
jgi:hypothetical protein